MSCCLLAVAEEVSPEKKRDFQGVRLYALNYTRLIREVTTKYLKKLNFQAKQFD
jgi:hypothetical protein